MTVNEIVRLVSLFLSLLISFAGLIVAIIKAVRTKKWHYLRNALEEFLAQAESNLDSSDEEKKSEVLAKAQEYCSKEGIKFEADKIESVITGLLSLTDKLTKKVNNDQSPQNDEEQEKKE